MRGFEANRVLLVVDGIRMNNAIYRSGHLQNAITVDPLGVDRVGSNLRFFSCRLWIRCIGWGGSLLHLKPPRINNPKTFTNRFSSQLNSAREAVNYHFESKQVLKNGQA